MYKKGDFALNQPISFHNAFWLNYFVTQQASSIAHFIENW